MIKISTCTTVVGSITTHAVVYDARERSLRSPRMFVLVESCLGIYKPHAGPKRRPTPPFPGPRTGPNPYTCLARSTSHRSFWNMRVPLRIAFDSLPPSERGAAGERTAGGPKCDRFNWFNGYLLLYRCIALWARGCTRTNWPPLLLQSPTPTPTSPPRPRGPARRGPCTRRSSATTGGTTTSRIRTGEQ